MSSEELSEVVPPDISMLTSRFQPLNPRQSPVAMTSAEQVVVESPTQYKPPVESLDVSPAADRQLIPLESQVSIVRPVVAQQSAGGFRIRYLGCVSGISSVTGSQWIFSRYVPGHVTGRPEHTEFTGRTGSRFSAE